MTWDDKTMSCVTSHNETSSFLNRIHKNKYAPQKREKKSITNFNAFKHASFKWIENLHYDYSQWFGTSACANSAKQFLTLKLTLVKDGENLDLE